MSSNEYSLTLTSDERKAIDFVGDRYWCGDDLFHHLINARTDKDWDDSGDVEFIFTHEEALRLAREYDKALHEGDIALLARPLLVKLWDFSKGAISDEL